MRCFLNHRLVMGIALILAMSGLNIFAIAPVLANRGALCGPTDNAPVKSSCAHCASGGVEACTCNDAVVCNCGETNSEDVPVPANIPSRTDTAKNLFLAIDAVIGWDFANMQAAISDSTVEMVAEARPIYLWNCILRT